MASDFTKHILQRIENGEDPAWVLDSELRPIRDHILSKQDPNCPCESCQKDRALAVGMTDSEVVVPGEAQDRMTSFKH